VLKFGPMIARRLRQVRPRPSDRWHLDEMVVWIAGKRMYLWRAVDHEGKILDAWFIGAALAVGATAVPTAQTPARRPNIVFILAADMGYADVSCYGRRDLLTPNIDRIAAQGTKFTQAYANSPVCRSARSARGLRSTRSH
jgi:hypothetical protein